MSFLQRVLRRLFNPVRFSTVRADAAYLLKKGYVGRDLEGVPLANPTEFCQVTSQGTLSMKD